ncbi:maleylpyruvate isomerase family mycothiol-dependent enzyme [Streptomyces sp. N2-109]|uniref:Maleylpyruvate isomerase family mycothiol-dependent enzyme n=1 Tax=Streptomyces gossypii TaxID=2883101 RepID=A0ABT2JYE2_9ACTN|nr:maleylpyruvate isomerase family mycothiol-dependent enzyme [Streptomyces gossypii]MCT2592913.1 maleylpyruvate isomerase family mycothiol-dependent enzyme [Streptomyces gossypii]
MAITIEHERYRTEIVHQTELLRQAIHGADLSSQVPTCPDWTLRELAVHVGGAHRWAAEMIAAGTLEELEEEAVPGFHGPGTDEPAALDQWLAEGAVMLADALRDAGPEAPVWTWAGKPRAGFWARRMTHETVIHRADACRAAGTEFAVAPEIAADCLDEWLEILSGPEQEDDEELRQLGARAGESLHLHATDGEPADDAEWLVELLSDGISWRRAHGKATVALRGPLTDLLLVFYRRLPPTTARVEVLGDAELLDFWLEQANWS